MESVPILGQQGFVDPSLNFEPVIQADQIVDMIDQPGPNTPISEKIENAIKSGFDYLFGAPTPEQAQNILETQPTSPSQRENLQAIVQGEERPSDMTKLAKFLLEPTGDTNVLGVDETNKDPGSTDEKSVSTAKEKEEEKPFVGSPNTPSGLGGPLLRGFNMVNNLSRNVPMGEEQTKALLAQRFGFDNPVTVNQAIANNPNLVMGTDAQGRMRTFASPEARQQNLANAQIAFNQASQDRQARIGGTGSFEGDSAARNARVAERDKRPGETQTERDTRIAKSRTQGSTEAGEMSFNDARKFVPKGQKETASSYNERIKAYQSQQNSRLNKLKENLEELRVTGQELNNQRTAAIISNYAENQPQKYSEVLADAQKMYEDGRIKDRYGMAVYIIEEMGGDLSKLTNEVDGFNPGQLNTKDRQAYDYAINNPNDPRSQQILDKLGVK
jgi:uncharacterized protein YaaR (DUF327 family)